LALFTGLYKDAGQQNIKTHRYFKPCCIAVLWM